MALNVHPAGIALGSMAVLGVAGFFVGKRLASAHSTTWRQRYDLELAEQDAASRTLCGRETRRPEHPDRSGRVTRASRNAHR
jgi:hypothetical protein